MCSGRQQGHEDSIRQHMIEMIWLHEANAVCEMVPCPIDDVVSLPRALCGEWEGENTKVAR